MGLGRSWARLVERRREQKRTRRRNRRIRMTWQTCRLCGSSSFLPARGDRICGGCLSLR